MGDHLNSWPGMGRYTIVQMIVLMAASSRYNWNEVLSVKINQSVYQILSCGIKCNCKPCPWKLIFLLFHLLIVLIYVIRCDTFVNAICNIVYLSTLSLFFVISFIIFRWFFFCFVVAVNQCCHSLHCCCRCRCSSGRCYYGCCCYCCCRYCCRLYIVIF